MAHAVARRPAARSRVPRRVPPPPPSAADEAAPSRAHADGRSRTYPHRTRRASRSTRAHPRRGPTTPRSRSSPPLRRRQDMMSPTDHHAARGALRAAQPELMSRRRGLEQRLQVAVRPLAERPLLRQRAARIERLAQVHDDALPLRVGQGAAQVDGHTDADRRPEEVRATRSAPRARWRSPPARARRARSPPRARSPAVAPASSRRRTQCAAARRAAPRPPAGRSPPLRRR